MIIVNCIDEDIYKSIEPILSELPNVKVVHGEVDGSSLVIPADAVVNIYALWEMLQTPASRYKYRVMKCHPEIIHDYIYYPVESIVGDGDDTHTYRGDAIYHIENGRIPFLFQMQITNQCTRMCKWCPPYHRKPATPEYMKPEVFERIMDIVEDYGIKNTSTLHFSRISEPTWDIDFLHKMTRRAKERLPGIRITIVTNGDWIRQATEKQIRDRLKYVDCISMNDYDSESGASVTDKLLNSHGDSRGGTRHQAEVIQRPEPHCWDRKRRVAFDVNGDIMACCRVTKLDPSHKGFVLGNIMDCHSYSDLVKVLDSFEMIEQCKTCTDSIQQMLKQYSPKFGYQYSRHAVLDQFENPDLIPITQL